MRTVTMTVKGASPYSASRYHEEPKTEGEGHNDHDRRTVLHKLHTDNGEVVIPGVQVKAALEWISKYRAEKIPEKRNKTWTNFFKAATMPLSDLMLGLKPGDFERIAIRCNAEGRKGGSLNVTRYFPQVREWGGTIDFAILDDTITEEVFERYMVDAGKFCGLGRWRPANGGMNGRFEITKFAWS